MTEQQEALATAKGLTDALTGMTEELGRQDTYGHRSRRMIWGLIVSIVLDLILTVFVAVTAIQAHNADTSANAAKVIARVAQQNNRNLCLSTNAARAQQIGLWAYIIGLSPPPQTADAKARTAKFEHHLAVIYAPRDCAHPSPGNPGATPSPAPIPSPKGA